MIQYSLIPLGPPHTQLLRRVYPPLFLAEIRALCASVILLRKSRAEGKSEEYSKFTSKLYTSVSWSPRPPPCE